MFKEKHVSVDISDDHSSQLLLDDEVGPLPTKGVGIKQRGMDSPFR